MRADRCRCSQRNQTDDAQNDYVFERRVFQDNGDGPKSFGRLDAYKRGYFGLEAKQGSDADREATKPISLASQQLKI